MTLSETASPTSTQTPLILQIQPSEIPEFTPTAVIPSGKITLPPLTTLQPSLTIDDTNVYWFASPDRIVRQALKSSNQYAPETVVATSFYKPGRLNLQGMLLRDDWLFFVDCDSTGVPANWTLRAINVKTYEEKVIARGTENSGPSLYDFESDGRQVSIAMGESADTRHCLDQHESVLSIVQIDSGKSQELDRACYNEDYYWWSASIQGDDLIASRTKSVGNQYYSEIDLFNLKKGTFQPIAGSLQANPIPDPVLPVPIFGWVSSGGSWVAWDTTKEGNTLLYNLTSRSVVPIVCTGCAGLQGPIINGQWLYFGKLWIGNNPNLFAYDLVNQEMHLLAVPGINEIVESLSINDDMAVWIRVLNSDQAARTLVIEWTNLANK